MDSKRLEELKRISAEVRKDVLRMVSLAGSGPFETSLSAADTLVYLYWEELCTMPSEPRNLNRDRFVTDITDAIPALYAVLARHGFFEREHLWHYRRLGAMLQAMPDFGRTPGIDAPCLSVGPSSAMASSMAEELFREGLNSPRVFFFTSERSFLSKIFTSDMKRIGKLGLPNLVSVVLSGLDSGGDPAKIGMDMLSSFGWEIRSAASDDFSALERAFEDLDFRVGAPKAVFVSASPKHAATLSDITGAAAERSLNMDDLDHALEELEVRLDERRQ